MRRVLLAILVGLLAVTLTGCFFDEDKADQAIENAIEQAENSDSATVAETAGQDDLVGTWKTGCLVPDLESDWAEQHNFTFAADGTAQQVRYSYDDHGCQSQNMETAMNYRYSIPADGQIDLIDEDTGLAMYDIYEITGSTLLLGHGFRNNEDYGDATLGASADRRINTLNEYLVYEKQ